MTTTAIAKTLKNAGFAVTMQGSSVVVSLSNRAVTSSEVASALGMEVSKRFSRAGDSVVVKA
jgi:hypothetical protein